jgi:hypothetical protein
MGHAIRRMLQAGGKLQSRVLHHSRARCSVSAALALLCAGLSTGCSRRTTGATIQEKTNPPTFRLLGSGQRTHLVVYGPYPDQRSLSRNFSIPAIWSVTTVGAAMSTPTQDLPLIQYGTEPAGFGRYSVSTPAPALELGRYYKMVVSATHGDTFYKNGRPHERFEMTNVCFLLDAAGASVVPCAEK